MLHAAPLPAFVQSQLEPRTRHTRSLIKDVILGNACRLRPLTQVRISHPTDVINFVVDAKNQYILQTTSRQLLLSLFPPDFSTFTRRQRIQPVARCAHEVLPPARASFYGPDAGMFIVSSPRANGVAVYSTAQLRRVTTVPLVQHAAQADLIVVGRRPLVLARGAHGATLFALPSQQQTAAFDLRPLACTAAAYVPHTSVVALGTDSGRIFLADVRNPTAVPVELDQTALPCFAGRTTGLPGVARAAPVRVLATDRAGMLFALHGGEWPLVSKFALSPPHNTYTAFAGVGDASRLALHPRHPLLALADGARLKVYETEHGDRVFDETAYISPIRGLQFVSPNYNLPSLIAMSQDETLLWSVDSDAK
eukprot:gnl/Chilomastix_cuspidata/3858.p1 GENE.gnl/Chilomastix_cuspidata/3858~~gnl/Chilomastix_cuspidata/3858.p1  ORF type:complete len:366 (+),score=144.79 gnl/Chilomastix_cuspidata/3858:1336-2433(+)